MNLFILFITTILADEVKFCFENMKQAQGIIQIALHNQPETFLNDELLPYKTHQLNFSAQIQCLDLDLPNGKYAVAVFEDENKNRKLDTNIMGIPKERFGFSQNPKVMFGPPNYEEVLIQVAPGTKIEIKLKSLL